MFQRERPDPLPIRDVHMLAELCPSDSLIDILAAPSGNNRIG
jgi:hypothetical protein